MTSKLVVNNIESDVGISSVTFADNIQIVSGSQYLTITHQGIDFQNTGVGSSTTATSHLLDDYEEGTWTPVIQGGTTAGSYTGTFEGTYTKIGNQVTLRWTGNLITESSAGAGTLLVTGIPFALAGNDCYGVAHIANVNFNDNAAYLVSRITTGNVNAIQIREIIDNNSAQSLLVTDIVSGSSYVHGQIAYFVA